MGLNWWKCLSSVIEFSTRMEFFKNIYTLLLYNTDDNRTIRAILHMEEWKNLMEDYGR